VRNQTKRFRSAGDALPRAPVATLRIRRATVRDVPDILSLIRGLAAYEKLAHEVRATARRIERDGFGRGRRFRVLLAIRGKARRRSGRARARGPRTAQPRGSNNVVGFALYFFTYSTFVARPTLFLEDIYVLPEERQRGAGKMLLRALAALAVRAGCGRMEWLVLANNTPAIRFYERLGAKLQTNWLPARLSGIPLRKLARGR